MTPQLLDHAYSDSCIVIGCDLVQPGRKYEHVYFSSQSHRSCITVAVTIVICEHEIARCCMASQYDCNNQTVDKR